MGGQIADAGNLTVYPIANSSYVDLTVIFTKSNVPWMAIIMLENDDYQRYLKSLPPRAEEKSTCSYLNALNKADRKKFKGMDITGVVNSQCSHVFVEASVDLQLGERFANTDYALAHAIRQSRRLNPKDVNEEFAILCDHLVSYDIACAYWLNVVDRFRKYFPELAPVVERIRWLIPLVHVQNHKENCMYLFSCAYTTGAGHHHGETAEQVWPESNQLGPQVRQMNNGHRQDTLIDAYNDWNFKKEVLLPQTLATDIVEAKELHELHRNEFLVLSELHSDKVTEWDKRNREIPESNRRPGRNVEVISVYRQAPQKVPSKNKVYQQLLEEIDGSTRTTRAAGSSPSGALAFLNEGLDIESEQRTIRAKVAEYKKDSRDEVQTTVNHLRKKLRSRLDQWRLLQKTSMTAIGDHVARAHTQAASTGTDHPENEELFLPSYFSVSERIDLGLVSLAVSESKLRIGYAYDCIQQIQSIVKTLAVLYGEKQREARGQDMNTRALAQIRRAESERDLAISHYNSSRLRILRLGNSDFSLAPLTVPDTYRKPTHLRRGVGDSRRFNGRIFHVGISGSRVQIPSILGRRHLFVPSTTQSVGTQASKRKKRTKSATRLKKGKKRKIAGSETLRQGSTTTNDLGEELSGAEDEIEAPKSDGWIWTVKGMGMSAPELQEWSNEQDRVQWFRAEAEMLRWLEQYEVRQADFRRCLRAFDRMATVWSQLASLAKDAGRIAYAKKKSAMYNERASRARGIAEGIGMSDCLVDNLYPDPSHGTFKTFVNFIENYRAELAKLMWFRSSDLSVEYSEDESTASSDEGTSDEE